MKRFLAVCLIVIVLVLTSCGKIGTKDTEGSVEEPSSEESVAVEEAKETPTAMEVAETDEDPSTYYVSFGNYEQDGNTDAE